ncbi:MAG: hypothetical protein ABI675_20015 [Chitinophagaceae bacterium]
MKGLNDRSNALVMQLIDQMGGGKQIRIASDDQTPLTIELLATDIKITKLVTGNLYNMALSDSFDGKTQNPGMQFLIVDNRIERSKTSEVEILPVTYRQDEVQVQIEIMTILNNNVINIERKLQHEYARFANQWIKVMAEMGYFKEYLQNVDDVIDAVCICGNNNELDGFNYCDETGNLTDTTDSYSHIICCQCNRIINIKSFEVIAKKALVKSLKASFDINKPIISMSNAEKAKLLHVLCPELIPGFLIYVNDSAQEVINTVEQVTQTALNETLSPVTWKELAKNVSQIITTTMYRLVEDSDLFARELFIGYKETFLLHCIQLYMSESDSSKFKLGTEFIFDL